jgi:hypothetical protein
MLLAVNSRLLDVIVLWADVAGSGMPRQLVDPLRSLPLCRAFSCRLRDLLTLCPPRGPTNYRVGSSLPAFMAELAESGMPSTIPKTERLVPLSYLTQNMSHGLNRTCGHVRKIPKWFLLSSTVSYKLVIPSVKQPLFRFGTVDAEFPLFKLHPAAEGNPSP